MRTASIQRINVLWFLTLGVTALAAGILVYILLLESALGAFSIREAVPVGFGDVSYARVLLHDGASSRERHAALYADSVGAHRYDSTLAAWRRIIDRRLRTDRLSQIIDDRSIANGEMEDGDLLVLPASIALSDEQIDQIRAFLLDGGSVLVSWGAGLYDGSGAWRGWGFMADVFGVQFDSFVEAGPVEIVATTHRFPGTVPDGLFIPRYRYESIRAARAAGRTLGDNALQRERMQRADAAEFPPLGEYVWYDTLHAPAPAFDYAEARGVRRTGGAIDSTQVTYVTFLGPEVEAHTPYPRTEGNTRRFTLKSGTPLTAAVPGGYRAKVQVYTPGVRYRIAAPDRAASAGFWYDFALDAPEAPDVLQPASGLVYGSFGAGRFVVMGFGPDALGASVGDPEDEQVFARLYDNLVSFLRRRPLVWTHDWPDGREAAILMAPVLDSAATGGREMLSLFESEGIPVTAFAVPEVSRSAPDLLRRFSASGEVALFDFYDPMLVSPEGHAARIRRSAASIAVATGRSVSGYRSAARGAVPPDVLSALAAEGFSYFLPDSIGRRTTPKIMGSPYESLARIGASARGERPAEFGPDSTADLDELLRGAYRVLVEGGLFRFSPRSALFAESGSREAVRSLVRRLKRENFWVATGEQHARWWRLRRGLNAAVEQRSPSRIFVRVSNDNGDTAEHATVSIALGRPVSSIVIKPELINVLKRTPDDILVPPYSLSADGTILELTIRELKPQQYRIFHIDLFSDELSARFAGR